MKRFSLVSMVCLVVWLIGAAVYPAPVFAAYVDGFDFPLDPRDGSVGRPSPYARYNVRNPYVSHEQSRCYGKPMSELQHAGEDWKGTSGSPVYAIATGQVVWSGATPEFFGVIIIEHTLPASVQNPWGGNTIYSMYGHLDPDGLTGAGTEVQRGQSIARLLAQDNPHLHLEVRRYGNMQDAPSSVNGYRFCNTSWAGPGYTDTNAHPDWFGYTEPSAWIDSHRRIRQPGAPTVAWVAPVTDDEIYRATQGVIRLEVSVADRQGIAAVHFRRWDAQNEVFVDIGTATAVPYHAVVNVNTLNMGWNQITATAVDTTGQRASSVIWIYRMYGVHLPQAHVP